VRLAEKGCNCRHNHPHTPDCTAAAFEPVLWALVEALEPFTTCCML
jgi:hypothetical protein